MVYPNAYCIGFCYWMLNTSWQVLTPPRLSLITTIYNAAVSGSAVTVLEYNNFTQTTSWRLPFYEAYLKNSLPFSLPPVGTCDFWLSASGIRINSSNDFGIVEFNGSVTRLSDVNGGSVFGSNALAARQPNVISIPSLLYSPNALSFNVSALQNLQLSNAGAMVQNSNGYSLFVIANAGTTGTARNIIYFSAGATTTKARIGIAVNSTGTWLGQAVRLDADAQASMNGSPASNNFQIIALTVDYSTGIGKIFTNGTLITTNPSLTSTGSTSNTASSAVSIGALNQANPWNGQFIDALAFQTALSNSDVLTITEWLNSMRSIY